MLQNSPQGLQQTSVGDLKRNTGTDAACKDSGNSSNVDLSRPSSATFRSSRPRTPDRRSDTCRESFRKAPMSARMSRTPSDHVGLAPTAPMSARVDHGRPFSAIPLRTTEDPLRNVGSLWPVDRSRRGGVTPGNKDGFDALDALVASACDDLTRSDAARTMSDSPRTKPGSELKCGIAPVRSQANTPLSSGRYDEAVGDFSPNIREVDDSRPSVYCSMSATLMSVHLPGSPIPNAVEFDDSDTSVVILTDPITVAKPQSRGQKVRFECHGPPKKAQSPAPQAPRRKGATSRPLGCTVIAFGGA
jgi:hypothetical protein